MECYSEEICAIFVDGELAPDEEQRLRDHLSACRVCAELVEALRAENCVLSEILRELPEEAVSPARTFGFRWSWVVATAALALGSIGCAWIDDWSVPQALDWLNPFSFSGRTNLIFDLSHYFINGGIVMLANYAVFVGLLSSLLLLGGSVWLWGRQGRLLQPGLRVLMVLFALSLSGFALERRHAEFVTIAANETVDDSVFAAGNVVQVDGVINGDLLAAGRTVQVRGVVKGDLVTWAQKIVVTGTVEGRIYAFAQTLDVDGQVDHSIYGWAQSLRVDNRAHIGDGIVIGAADVSLDGEVKRNVTIFASDADLSGSIGRDLHMSGNSLTLASSARVLGNLTARVHQTKNVHIADGATIAGKRDIQIEVHTKKSQFTRPRFYLHQALGIAAAILVGWLALVLFPGFFQASTQAVRSGWRSFALGIGILAGVPVAAIVAAITLIGLPISLMMLGLYLAAIYLAKIWVAAFLGWVLLKSTGVSKGEWLLRLLVGLLILTIVGFIPYLGGLVCFGTVCVGLGAFARQLHKVSQPSAAA